MGVPETLRLAHDALERAGVAHALIGGLAMAALGAQRSTKDVDFLVDGERRAEAKSVLLAAGFRVFHETAELLQLDGPGPLDCLFARRPATQAMLTAAALVPGVLGVRCVRPEDVIGLKIQGYANNPKRELQEKADIQAIARANPSLDWALVKTYADMFGQWTAIEAIRKLL